MLDDNQILPGTLIQYEAEPWRHGKLARITRRYEGRALLFYMKWIDSDIEFIGRVRDFTEVLP